MVDNSDLTAESSAVQTHLTIMQGVITRMAEHSRSCKVWCVTLVSAVLVLVAPTEKPEYTLIALVPASLFLVLDTYYLAHERAFRTSYSMFVAQLHGGNLTPADLYKIAPIGSVPKHFLASLKSFSIWPFYPTSLGMILFIWWLVNR